MKIIIPQSTINDLWYIYTESAGDYIGDDFNIDIIFLNIERSIRMIYFE